MDILKAAEIFEKLAQQKVQLQPQVVQAVSTQEIDDIVNSLMKSFAYTDPSVGWKTDATLMPDGSYKVVVFLYSNVIADDLVKQQLEEALNLRWPGTEFSTEVYAKTQ